jgi:cytochrome P450
MTYLEQYDALGEDTAAKVGLVNRWLRTEWRPFFAELRAERPVFRTPAYTMVMRYPDVTEVLSRERVFTVRPYASRMDPVVDGPFMLARDDTPVNWREKGIMQAVLPPEDLPRVRAAAGALADESLDAAAEEGRIEVVGRLGRYVPLRLCGDYFGFPGPDLQALYRWSKATQSDMFKNLQNDPAVHEANLQAGREMRAYLAELLATRRGENGNGSRAAAQDTVGRLVRTRLPDDIGFDDSRVLANVAGLLIGSGETTSQAIVHALAGLLGRPDAHAEAVDAAREDDPARFDRYVWEALRLNPVNPLLFRLCEATYTLAAGTPREAEIAAGTLVFACTASAMSDEDVVEEPDAFRTDRPSYLGLHFGYGHHSCLGRHVAGVVVPEVVRRVLLRPGVELLPAPEGTVDFAGGPFPERFVIRLGAPATVA